MDVPVEAWFLRFEAWFAREGVVDDKSRSTYIMDIVDLKIWPDVASLEGKPYKEVKEGFFLLFKRPVLGTAHYADFMDLK